MVFCCGLYMFTQKSLFSLLWTPCVTGAFALTFFQNHIPAPTPIAPATETALTVPVIYMFNRISEQFSLFTSPFL